MELVRICFAATIWMWMTFLLILCVVNLSEEATGNSTVFAPFTIQCPVAGNNKTCQCDPPNITLTDADSSTAFDRVSCELTPDLITPTNPKRFFFPPSKNVEVICTDNNSLVYAEFLQSVEQNCGSIIQIFESKGFTYDCFRPFVITADMYLGFPNLRRLTLSVEHVISISPNAFSPLKRLDRLYLTHLSLQNLHPHIFSGLTHLRELSLWSNDISKLPDDVFDDLQDLQALALAENRLTYISRDVFKPLVFLNILLLNDNRISSIHPDAFSLMKNLKELDLSRNEITGNLPLRYLGTENLFLSHNLISSFTENTVGGVQAIKSADLSHNLITYITDKVLLTDDYSSLSSVDLNNNLLESLPKDLLRWARKLTSVDFRNNSLGTLPDGLFNIQSNPIGENRLATNQLAVKLAGNPFSCDCRLTWFRQYDRQDVWIHDRDDIKCFSPSNLNGTSLFAVPPQLFRCPLSDSVCPIFCECYEIWTDPGLVKSQPRVVIVKCKSGNLTRISKGLPTNTSVLDLSGNHVIDFEKDVADFDVPLLNELMFTGCNISSIKRGIFRMLNSLSLLKLDGNNFHHIPKGTFKGLTLLNMLYLNHSNLYDIDDGVFLDTPMLNHLYLHGNFLKVLPNIASFPKGLVMMTLNGNPLICSCNLISFQGWLKYNLEVQGNSTCRKTKSSILPIAHLDSSSCKTDNTVRTTLAVLGTMFCVILATVVCAVLYKKNKTRIQLMWLRYFPQEQSEDDNEKPFDIFISYSQHDDEFVLRYLAPLLEDEADPPYSLCLHYRHFIPGDTITNNIVNAVVQSRRVILVLSENFLQSDWCMYEFRMAHIQALYDRCNTLFIITLGEIAEDSLDPDLKAHIRSTTYLKSCDPDFKDKLLLALKRAIPRQNTRIDSPTYNDDVELL